MKGMVQVYTGAGKGKTTAALGAALRAIGAGYKVFLAQFVKGKIYHELSVISEIDNFDYVQYGRGCFIEAEPTAEDILAAQKGLQHVEELLIKGDYGLIILDEALIAVYFKLFSTKDLLQTIAKRARGVEVIITGRYAEEALMKEADLVTEMQEIKHYFQQGVAARKGFEY